MCTSTTAAPTSRGPSSRCGSTSIARSETLQSETAAIRDCCPNEPWPILKVRIHFHRALAFYTLGFIVPVVIFTAASFMVFLMGEKSGERIGLGVTLMLVIEVTKYTVQAWLPKCGELLWMDLFIFVNTCFTAHFTTFC